MSDRTFYQILQVDSEASPEVIEAAYRRLAKLYHPDLSKRPDAVTRMQEINEAYSVLQDAAKRRQYDDKLRHTRESSSTAHAKPDPPGNTTDPKTNDGGFAIPPDYPVSCEKCGASDASLRMAGFPYVVSFILMTSRRYRSGVFCKRCRRSEMRNAKLMSFFLGWWGIPFGILYTVGTLFKPSEGEVPSEPNAIYLRGLGAYFLQTGRISAAKEALGASLRYRFDPELASVYRQMFGEVIRPGKPPPVGELGGALFGVGALLTVALFLLFMVAPASSPPPPPSLLPTPTPTPTSSLMPPPPAGWRRYSSEEARFSAFVPERFEVEVRMSDADTEGTWVLFYSREMQTAADSVMIRVGVYPIAEDDRSSIPSWQLKQWAENWLAEVQPSHEIKTISQPRESSINGFEAAEMVYDVTQKSEVGPASTFRVHEAWLVDSSQLYQIEVAGEPESVVEIRRHYRIFLDAFLPGHYTELTSSSSSSRSKEPTVTPTSRPTRVPTSQPADDTNGLMFCTGSSFNRSSKSCSRSSTSFSGIVERVYVSWVLPVNSGTANLSLKWYLDDHHFLTSSNLSQFGYLEVETRKSLKAGKYRVELWAGNKLVNSADFTIR